MNKISTQFILQQYQSGVESYVDFTKAVGLWASEKAVFNQYLQKTDTILDIGCGTGRTTFPLFKAGYKHITGIDLTPEMIIEAQNLNTHFGTTLKFQVADACHLSFETGLFDAAIFSFNGIMSIPQRKNRVKALQEINRVLKTGSLFIFTTHDREKEPAYLGFWQAEAKRWENGEQNPRLFEFGDLITTSKNEERQIFIHIPNQAEVKNLLTETGFELIETFYRSDRFQESEAVKAKSGECRFWITRKLV